MKKYQTSSVSKIFMGRTAIILAIICALLLMSGCGAIQIQPADKEDIIWGSANLLGYHAIQKHPDYALKGEDIAINACTEC